MLLKRLQWLLAIVLGAAAYFGATRIGYAIAFVHGTVSAVWPPTGVALALVWIGGPRMLPAVFLGELTGDLINGSPLLVSTAFGLGSAAEALAGYGLLRALHFRSRLDRVRDVFALLAAGALLSTMVSASIGTATLLVHGDISPSAAWSTWHVWWLGDATGDIVVAPLALVLGATRLRWPRGWRLPETAGFAATLAALGVAAHSMASPYLVLPVLIWAALRFRSPGAVLANAVLASAGVIGAAGAASGLARVSILDRILFTQNFVAVGAITTLVLAALIAERDRADGARREAQATADALAADRRALGLIATAIARDPVLEHILALVARCAARRLGGSGAAFHRDAAGARQTIGAWLEDGVAPGPGEVSVAVSPGLRAWGELRVCGLPSGELPSDRPQLLQRFADLAELAIINAQARTRLVAEARTDALTGLSNQRAFRRRLSDEVQRSRRYGRPVSLVLFDLDGFKAINDRCGHLAGDFVLGEVARRACSAVRIEAMVARLGGDEMALLLPECDVDGALVAAERVREAVGVAVIADAGRVTLSGGVAELTIGDEADDDHLIRHADLALYTAKRLGGDNCVCYSDGVEDRSRVFEGQPPVALDASC